jgi:hypothetical protein
MVSARHAVSFGWLLLSVVLSGADLDGPAAYQMRLAAPGNDQVRVLTRIHADSELDLVATVASQNNLPGCWWGVFFQRRNHPGTIYKISVQQFRGDCGVRVERASATDLVVSCPPQEGFTWGPSHRFLFDLHSKSLTGQVEYQPYSLQRLFVSNGSAVMVGSDRKSLAALDYDPDREPLFHLLTGAAASKWTSRIQTRTESVGTGSESKQFVDVEPKRFRTLAFGPEHRFALISTSKPDPFQTPHDLAVVERSGKRSKLYRFPQSSYDEFARLRPGRVRDGYSRDVAEFYEQLGSAQVADGSLWFGKTFYDGEGSTGVGGFGFFDTQTERYKVYSPPEVVDWSVGAMLVEPEVIWLGLENHGEYGNTSGGLLRWNRRMGNITKFELPDRIFEIARVGSSLLLATDFGPAIVKDDKVHRFFIHPTTRGQLQVSEASAGK